MIKITRTQHPGDRILRLTFTDRTMVDDDLNSVVERDAPMVAPLKDLV